MKENIISMLTRCFFVLFCFVFQELQFSADEDSALAHIQDNEETGVCSLDCQSVVSLHTQMRLWGWRGGWWSGGAGTSVWLDPLGGRRKDEDGELKAPQLCKCRSSWACFLRLPMIFCDCVINYVKNMKKPNIPNVIQFSDFSLSTKHK